MAGLTRKKISVKSKSGKVYQRSVMVRAGQAVKRVAGRVKQNLAKHSGKIGAVTTLAGLALAGHYRYRALKAGMDAEHHRIHSESNARMYREQVSETHKSRQRGYEEGKEVGERVARRAAQRS